MLMNSIVKLKQVDHTLNEKRILDAINFPFLVNLKFYFKDNINLYMIQDFIQGGEMFSHLRRLGRFSENFASFYACQVVMSFEYLHSLDILYRDLKPENILIDEIGYIREILQESFKEVSSVPEPFKPPLQIIEWRFHFHGRGTRSWILGSGVYIM
ncbi:cAMP-dependent protein kinase catalytic subunit gamma-like [Centruroides sculpturatus]|uniref:cAMP-dependent protein kinase catalytic subunit gamma-like n=1 Tax=Centruroides sculpturatus TaxID=218467 RepID=UPI000C6F007E|nr:cAMP-dependent protein kinase catalytic subunit gamma-like [Centruroides sculpturatus]